MFKKIHILFSILALLAIRPAMAQDERQCVGTKALYRASGEQGSTFMFEELISGGTIITQNPTDSIVVEWGQTRGSHRLGVLEISQYGCYGDWAYSDILLVGEEIIFGQPGYTMCEGDSVLVDFNQGAFQAYSWSPEIPKNGYVKQAGDYTLTAIDQDNCRITNTVTVDARPMPFAYLGNDTMICTPDFRLFADKQNKSPEGTIFTWSVGQSNGSDVSYIDITNKDLKKNETYWVRADFDGCQAHDTIVILACEDIYDIPNTFTPNGDGDNDTWEIRALSKFPNAVVEVYDRWARKVFSSAQGYPQAWDGRDTKGHVLPLETYYYIINLNDGKGGKPLLGTITIIR